MFYRGHIKGYETERNNMRHFLIFNIKVILIMVQVAVMYGMCEPFTYVHTCSTVSEMLT